MLWLNFIFENLFFQNLLYILFFKKRATFFNNFVGFINLREVRYRMKTKNTAFKGIILFLLILLCIGVAYAAEDTITDNPNLNYDS